MSYINPPSSTGGVVQTYATIGDLPLSAADGTIAYVEPPTDSLYVYSTASSTWNLVGGGGVAGPGSSTDNAVVRFDGTTGQTIQNSVVIIGDTGNVSGVNNLSVTGTTTLATSLTGPVRASSGVISTGNTSLTSEVTGTLPVANGGTNSSTALNNNRVMVSNSGAIQEAAAITASRALASDANGIPVASVTTATELGYVNGVTSSIQTQLDGKEPSITVLPISKGGTNSGTALNNNRIVQSSGGALIEAPAITASRALVSDTNGIPVAATTTATEIGYVNGVTSSIQTQLDARQNRVLPVTNQMVYVNQLTGSDVTGTGSYDKPFQTVIYAMTQITDASLNKPYTIMLQSNRQIETGDLFIKPYVFIVGEMQRATYFRVNSGQIKPDPSHATGTSWVGFNNLYLGGGTVVNWDLQALGGSNCTMVLQNLTTTGTFTYKGRNAGGGDYLEIYNTLHLSTYALDSVYFQLQFMEIGSTVTLTNTQAVTGMEGNFNFVTFDAGAAITSYTNVTFSGCNWPSTSSLTTTGTVGLTSYNGLPPTSRRSFSGGTTVTDRNNATTLSFTPTTSGDWSVAPTNVQQGIDSLATSGIYKSQTAKYVLAAPNATNAVPSFRQLVSTDITGVNSDLQTQIDGKLSLSGGTMTGTLTLNADPTLALQAATKQYVDAISQGIAWKQSVKAATTADITLSGNQTIDGVSLVDGDRVLVKNQNTTSENGIYVVASGAWSRSSDANTAAEINSAAVSVEQGTANADRGFLQNATVTTLGTDPVTFVQIFGVGTYTADGQGIELTGNVFSLELDGSTLSKSGTGVKVAAGGITDTEVNASAAITRSKLAAGTANTFVTNDASGVIQSTAVTASRAVVTDSNGLPTASAATATEVGYLSGVTSAIQTQLDGKQTTTLTSGNILVGNGSNVAASVTMSGDVTINNTGVTAISSGVIVDADVNASAAIARTKLAAGTNNTFVTNNSSGVMQSTSVTASRAVATDADGLPVASTTTATELGYLAGTTSSVQTQIDGKLNLTGGTLTGNLTVSNANQLRLGELTANGSDYISLRAPNSLSASYDLVMPSTSTSGSLTNDGSGNLSWSPTSVTPAYVGTNPEVGGSSPFQMLSTNNKNSVLNPAGAITVRLPTTGVVAGDTYTITNRSTNNITIQSSNGTGIIVLNNATMTFTALVNTPTGGTDWNVRQTSGTLVYGNQNSSIAAGYLGEELFAQNINFSVGAATGFQGVASFTVSVSGWYLISAFMQFGTGGNAGFPYICVSSTAGNASFPEISPKGTDGYTYCLMASDGYSPNTYTGSIQGVRVYLPASTVIYLYFTRGNSVTVTGGFASISAVRIA